MTSRTVAGAIGTVALLLPGAAHAASTTTRIAVPARNGVEVLEAKTVGTESARVALAPGARLPVGTTIVASADRSRLRVAVVRKSRVPTTSQVRLVVRGARGLRQVARTQAVVLERSILRSRLERAAGRRPASLCEHLATPPAAKATTVRGRFGHRSAAGTMRFAETVLCLPRFAFDPETLTTLAGLGYTPPRTAPARPAPTAPAAGAPATAPAPAPAGRAAPQLRVTAASQDFGDVVAQETSTRTFTVENTGDAEARNLDSGITGANRFEFEVRGDGAGTCATTLAAAASCTLEVAFTPFSGGPLAATLLVVADGAGTSAPLTGTGLRRAQLVVQSGDEQFGSLPVGRSVTRTFVLVNDGDVATAPTSNGGWESGGHQGFAYVRHTCAGVIQPGGTCEIDLRFTPRQQGATGDALYTFAGGDIIGSLNPAGTGAAPIGATLDPQGASFGTNEAGGAADTRTVTVTNHRDIAVTYTPSVDNAKFTIEPGSDCLAPVAAGATCTLSITYLSPVAASDQAVLAVADDTAQSAETSTTAELSGYTVDPVVVFSPAPDLAFGQARVEDTSVTRPFTLRNQSDAEVTGLAVTNQDAAFTIDPGSCGATLAAGATCSGTVTFAPVTDGEAHDVLFVSADQGLPKQAPMTGTGLPALQLQ